MNQCWPIGFLENIWSYLQRKIWSKSEKILVESCVVKRAEREPIGNDGFPLRITVRNDVGCIQHLFVAESTKGATSAISIKDAFSKGALV